MGINLNTSQRWAEYWTLFLLLIGFLLTLWVDSPQTSYVVAVAFGLLLGRMLWQYKQRMRGSIITILLGFIMGFLLGVQVADRKLLIILLVAGMLISYYAHDRKLIQGTAY
ncbi:hypothetical protein HY492_04205 [Candidatus Woesearchaeota archaeon]|nr:hypothetical protein [Candidatus Woesearchaeota archaeon]